MISENIGVISRRKMIAVVLALLVGVLAITLFGGLTGPLADFLNAGLEVAVFVILAMLAYLGTENPRVRPFAVIWLLGLLSGVAMFSMGFGVISITGLEMADDLPADLDLVSILEIFLLCISAPVVSLIGFSRTFRGFVASYLPIDPDNFVHTIALVTVLALILIPPIPLAVTGIPPLLSEPVQEALAGEDLTSVSLDAFSLLWTVFGSFLLVGLYVRRDFGEACERLGFVWPSARQVAGAVVLAVILVGAFTLLDTGITVLWKSLGWPVTDSEAVEFLFASALTPLGIVVASISAGFGEELAVRGVLQPRFGIILSSLLFASLHAWQYAWDGLISVFIAGLVFACVRRYSNTTTSAVTHTLYDAILFWMIMVGL